MAALKDIIVELIKRASSELPEDVINAIQSAKENEDSKSNALDTLNTILENCQRAQETSLPLCQDTGAILFYVKIPKLFDPTSLKIAAAEAVAEATLKGLLRENSVDVLSGKNTGNNLGVDSPHFTIKQWDRSDIEIRLMLKGGGSENVSTQYSLPNIEINAERNFEGVTKCALDAVFKAQGKGCAPGVLGICIGGDRATGYLHAKEQLLRKLDDTNNDPQLAKLESEILSKANKLKIGPMGFGGNTTILACKIGNLNRIPASYFVTVSYMCWADRRQGITIDSNFNIKKWLY